MIGGDRRKSEQSDGKVTLTTAAVILGPYSVVRGPVSSWSKTGQGQGMQGVCGVCASR